MRQKSRATKSGINIALFDQQSAEKERGEEETGLDGHRVLPLWEEGPPMAVVREAEKREAEEQEANDARRGEH